MIRLISLAIILCFAPLCVSAQSPFGPKEVSVTTTRASIHRFSRPIEALGTLRANETVDVTSTVTEIVTKIYFKDGQRVAFGDLLLEMDAAEELADDYLRD